MGAGASVASTWICSTSQSEVSNRAVASATDVFPEAISRL